MRIKQLKPTQLTPYENNAKKHSDAQIDAIEKSIIEFGFVNPILIDPDKMVIAGHGRLQAALNLGIDKVPTIELTDLSPEQRRAYIIADNRLSEIGGGWDENMLNFELSQIADMLDVEITGFMFTSEDYTPTTNPVASTGAVTDADIDAALAAQDKIGSSVKSESILCPHCGGEFSVR